MKTRFTRNIFLGLFYVSFVIAILTVAEPAVASEMLGTVAVTDAFYGQLIIAMIAAMPPTGMLVIAFILLLRGQNQMKVALDGKLDKLMAAEKGVSKAEGGEEERIKAREHAVMDAPAATAAIVAATVAAVAAAPQTISKIEVVNDESNPVPLKLGKAGLL